MPFRDWSRRSKRILECSRCRRERVVPTVRSRGPNRRPFLHTHPHISTTMSASMLTSQIAAPAALRQSVGRTGSRSKPKSVSLPFYSIPVKWSNARSLENRGRDRGMGEHGRRHVSVALGSVLRAGSSYEVVAPYCSSAPPQTLSVTEQGSHIR